MPQDWIVNANYNEKVCETQFDLQANNNLGINGTFEKSSILISLIGIVFGQTYSLNYVRPLLWVYTPAWKRVIRTILGLSIAYGVFYAFDLVLAESNDIATRYFFGSALPMFLMSFFIFGLYPIICNKIGLVL